jgi:tripartite-type tricarboxylate transporter receptor subunit TctC
MNRQGWSSRIAFSVIIVTLVNAAFHSAAVAQDWPTRPVTMVYPFAAGSGGDDLGRILLCACQRFWTGLLPMRTRAERAA